ncbi:hypothetical protein AX16_010075 [Volvariella volvacea WC 439]|nr:hypothetical protein AX16_010075 [Volvariella volvacea WC 439]
MSTVTQFDTQTTRAWDKPQGDTSAEVKFPRTFVAPPRLPCGLRWLDVSRTANIRAKSGISGINNDSATYHVSSWGDSILYSGVINSLNLAPANLDILNGEHTRLRADPSSVRIKFERPFVTPPKVVVFFNHIDLDKSKNWRLKTTATNIDTEGFTLTIDTWGDTFFYGATAGWIAYPEDREHIFSASVNTMDVRPWDEPQFEHSKALSFGDVEFWKNPSIFLGFNYFDLGCLANLRLKAYVDGVTTSGLAWHIDSWADSVLYAAGVTIIAVN